MLRKYMNKTLWQALIIGAAAEAVMFVSLVLNRELSLARLGNGYLYIFALIFFYLSVLRIFKSYNAAFFLSLTASFVPSSGFIYAPAMPSHLAGALFCGMSFFSYTFTDARGLKHNQDKQFLFLSFLLYAAALYFSKYAAFMPCVILIYEIINKKSGTRLQDFKEKAVFLFILFFASLAVLLQTLCL